MSRPMLYARDEFRGEMGCAEVDPAWANVLVYSVMVRWSAKIRGYDTRLVRDGDVPSLPRVA